MNVNKMEAGRETDALIAEKVVGLLREYQPGRWSFNRSLAIREFPNGVKELSRPNIEGEKVWERGNGDRYFTQAIPRYSTDMAAAWEVVEKMQQKFFVRLICGRNEGRKNARLSFSCDIGYYETSGKEEWYSEANTMPLAICRAALQVLEVWR